MAMKVFVLALSVASAYVPCSTRRAVVSCNLGNSGNSKNNNRNAGTSLSSASASHEASPAGPLQRRARAVQLLLAKLSLRDFEWRRGVLDRAETAEGEELPDAVAWLGRLLEEERARAEAIVARRGELIRPMDVAAGGPLGAMEARATAALRDLEPGRRAAEDARRTAAWRGKLESTAIDTTSAEFARCRLLFEDGKLVRPLDVEGDSALKSIEALASGVIDHEVGRAARLQDVRPMQTDPTSAAGRVEAFATGLLRAPVLIFALGSAVASELAEATEYTAAPERPRPREIDG